MTAINLLPWREERRRRKQRELIALLLAGLGLTGMAFAGVHFHLQSAIEHQNRRNQFLQNEIAALDGKIKEIQDLENKKRRVVAQMGIIQNLQSSRPEIVHLLDELAQTVPEGIQLLDMKQADAVLTIEGIAQSNARVSAYMRNLESSPWLKDPSLNVIEAKAEVREIRGRKTKGNRFVLQVRQANEKDEPKGDGRS